MKNSIEVNSVSKKYRIGKGLTSLRGLFDLRQDDSPSNYHWAVQGVSFMLRPGESLGIIGPNGAGKTTLLKLLTQVTRPTMGSIHLNGRFSALIELGAGFHPDLTGRENVFLNGSILGMTRSEIRDRFEKIVDFAGIGDYLDTPVKRYSSGMYARLGFSIAAHVDPEILLVDEVLAVGDYAFRQKCYTRMDELRGGGTSLILVSHDMEAVRRVCDKGLVMYRGENIFQGTASEAIVAYSDAVRNAARESKKGTPKEEGLSQRVMTFDAEIEGVQLLDALGNSVTVINSGSSATVSVDFYFHKDVCQPIFSMTVRSPDGGLVYDVTTRWLDIQTQDFLAGDRCRVEFVLHTPLLDGEYFLGVDVIETNLSYYYDRLERALSFWVQGNTAAKGLVDMAAKVSIKKISSIKKVA
jgi:ABC-type polysaccharide/polyol phosphate transport system ATPase subunit